MLEEVEVLPIIKKLPENYRLVFNMYVFEEYSHKEIAEKLNIAEGTSKSCLSRAKKIIKEYMLMHGSKYKLENG
jgi:RNA polymerase sigma-70 factor (ECF subfamily)